MLWSWSHTNQPGSSKMIRSLSLSSCGREAALALDQTVAVFNLAGQSLRSVMPLGSEQNWCVERLRPIQPALVNCSSSHGSYEYECALQLFCVLNGGRPLSRSVSYFAEPSVPGLAPLRYAQYACSRTTCAYKCDVLTPSHTPLSMICAANRDGTAHVWPHRSAASPTPGQAQRANALRFCAKLRPPVRRSAPDLSVDQLRVADGSDTKIRCGANSMSAGMSRLALGAMDGAVRVWNTEAAGE